jgi:hypothetical protein
MAVAGQLYFTLLYFTLESCSMDRIKRYNTSEYETCCHHHLNKAKAVPLHAMKALGGEEVYLLLILDTRWGEWSASRPGRALAPGKGGPGTHCTGS